MHQASVNSGNSGGPLFSKVDESVVGINSNIKRFLSADQPGDERSLLEGFNFSIAIDEATSMIAQLEIGTVVQNPADAWLNLVSRAYRHHLKGQYVLAINDFTAAIRLNPGDLLKWRSYLGRGHSYYALGQYEAAIQDYEAAISSINSLTFEFAGDSAALFADFASSFVYTSKGRVYNDLGQYEHAKRDYKKAIKLSHSESADAYNGRGNAYYGLGQYEHAIRDYSKAIKLDGQTAVFYNNRSDAYAKASARDEAKAKELGYKLADGPVSGDWEGEFITEFSLVNATHGKVVQYRAVLKEATFSYYIPKWFLERVPRVDLGAGEEWPGSLVIEIAKSHNVLEENPEDPAMDAVLEYSYIGSKKHSELYEINHEGQIDNLYVPNEVMEGEQAPKRLRVHVSE
jgi:tetratricopeptide (TPR) repeat protein